MAILLSFCYYNLETGEELLGKEESSLQLAVWAVHSPRSQGLIRVASDSGGTRMEGGACGE